MIQLFTDLRTSVISLQNQRNYIPDDSTGGIAVDDVDPVPSVSHDVRCISRISVYSSGVLLKGAVESLWRVCGLMSYKQFFVMLLITAAIRRFFFRPKSIVSAM